VSDEEEVGDGEITVLERLDPSTEVEDIILKTASMVKFRKLGDEHNLIVHVQGTRCSLGPTRYLSKSKDHNIGDVKEPGYEYRMISITLTNGYDFGAQATWYERFPKFRDGTPKPPVFEFDGARIGGKRTGHRPSLHLTQSTKTIEEINRCLAPSE
jgi:hypothetical protein